MTVNFSPSTVSGTTVATTVATFSAVSTLKGGNYKVTINATGGGVTQSVTYLVNVFVRPSCSLTPNVYSASFKAGSGTNFFIKCSAASASSSLVNLSVAGAPGGITARFLSPTVSPTGTATLNITSTSTVTPGTYYLTVTGSEPNGATQTVWLYFAVSTPVFTLSLNPTNVTAYLGSTTQFTAVVTPDAGFASPVNVWMGGVPNGVGRSIGTNSIANPSTPITLTIDKNTTPGTYPLLIGAGTNTGYSLEATGTLTILAPPACMLSSGSLALGLVAGQSTSVRLNCPVSSGSFSSPLSIAVAGLPSGVTAQFSPATLTPGASTILTLTSTTAAKVGSGTLAIAVSGSGYAQGINLPLTVAPVPACALAANASSVNVVAGNSSTLQLTCSVTSGSFPAPLSLALTGLPAGVTAQFSSATLTPGSYTTLRLTSSTGTRAVTSNVTLTATGPGFVRTLTLPVSVAAR